MTSRGMAAVLATAALASVAAAADPPGSPRANEALALCNRAQKAPADQRRPLLERGLTLAEEAIAADERDAKAHFAVFCNLGKQMRLRGVGVRSLLDVRRLRHEVDRTIELAPDYTDALRGKGALLIDLPRVLGGDPKEGERFLRAALGVDPDDVDARLALAHALEARGARAEALDEARRAVAAAERDPGDAEDLREARALLARLEK